MKKSDFTEITELLNLLRKLPPKLREEIYFMLKGAALVADNESA